MNKSETLGKLATALNTAQKEMEPALKDAENPFFRSRYADLTSVWRAASEPLGKNGLSVSQISRIAEPFPYQALDNNGNTYTAVMVGVIVETVLLHSSGEWLSGEAYAPLTKNDAQAVGSATTYLRRYGLAAILGIVAEDDDGNGASGNGRPNQTQPNAPAPRNEQRAAERFAQSPITPSVAKDLDQAAAQFAKKQQVGNPMAQTLGDMITSKQLGMVRAIARELDIDVDAECSHLLGCNADELSKRGASDFIEHLQELQKHGIPQTAPAIDYIGTGEAKKKEAKLRQLGAALNNAGVSVPLDRYAEPTQWSSGTLNDYCLDGFDIALADLNKAQMDTLIGDLNDMLQERLAMTEA